MASNSSTLSPAVVLTADGAIDVAAALTSDDAHLSAAIGEAAARMRLHRVNRAGLAFLDAKMADTVLRAERQRRQVAAHQAAVVPAQRLHPCGSGCTDSLRPVEDCRCECAGANHSRTTMVIETYPHRTVYARAELLAEGVWIGYDAIRDHYSTWTVRRVLDRASVRTTDPVAADFPDRAAAEQHALALATGGAR